MSGANPTSMGASMTCIGCKREIPIANYSIIRLDDHDEIRFQIATTGGRLWEPNQVSRHTGESNWQPKMG